MTHRYAYSELAMIERAALARGPRTRAGLGNFVDDYGRQALITNGGYSVGAALLGGLLVGFGAKKAGASPKVAVGAGVVGAGVAGAAMFSYTSGWLW